MIRDIVAGRESWLGLFGIVVILAAGVWGWNQWNDLADVRSAVDDDTAAVDAASETVTALINVDAATADDALADIVDASTEAFKDQFATQAETFRNALVGSNVDAAGEVVSAGLVERDGDRATVAVAATGTVTQGEPGSSTPRYYRLTVELAQTDGQWLVAGMVFV